MKVFKLSKKFFATDWYNHQLTLILACITIAVGIITAISFFHYRIKVGLSQQATALLGGDLILSSPAKINDKINLKAKQLSLKTSNATIFPSMLLYQNNFQLSSIKAVTKNYPLKGHFMISKKLLALGKKIQNGPLPGEVWLAPRLADVLNIKIGEKLSLGNQKLRLSGFIQYEPNPPTNWLNIAPRAVINDADLEKINVLQPGSRADYRLILTGNDHALAQFKQWIIPKLTPGQKIYDRKNNLPGLRRSLNRMMQYLNLATLFCVLLAGIAISISTRYYSQKHFDHCALLRCFGASQRDISRLFTLLLLKIGILGSILGCILGYLSQWILVTVFKNFLAFSLAKISIAPIIIGMALGIILTLSFGLPHFLSLKDTPTMRLLHQDLTPTPIRYHLLYFLGMIIMLLIMLLLTQDILLTAYLMMGGFFISIGLGLVGNMLLNLLKMNCHQAKFSIRYSLGHLTKNSYRTLIQAVSFSLVLMATAILIFIRNDLLHQWQQNLPEKTPNYFAVNILPKDVNSMKTLLTNHHIHTATFYPIVRARLTELNDQPILTAVSAKGRRHNSLKRQLNLSATNTIPDKNQIIAGKWWQKETPHLGQISIEREMATSLGIKIGDKLTLNTNNDKISGIITNVRDVEWQSFQPNFYLLFPQNSLAAFPATYITSLYVKPEQQPVISELTQRFPSISFIDINNILKNTRHFIVTATDIAQFILFYTFLACTAIMLALLQEKFSQRAYDIIIMRTLGATKKMIRNIIAIEYFLLGVIASLIAILGAKIVTSILSSAIFHMPNHIELIPMLLTFVSGVVFITLTGIISANRLLYISPKQLLARQP